MFIATRKVLQLAPYERNVRPSPGSGKINIALLTERNIYCISTGL